MAVAALVVAPVADFEEESGRQHLALTGVVGHWSDTTAGTPAVVVNGEKWSGTTSKGELENASRRLFGSVNDTFLANMTSATVFPVAVVPEVAHAPGGGPIVLHLELSGTQPACTFKVSPETLVVKITSGDERIWTSQECPKAIPTTSVVVRSAVPATAMPI